MNKKYIENLYEKWKLNNGKGIINVSQLKISSILTTFFINYFKDKPNNSIQIVVNDDKTYCQAMKFITGEWIFHNVKLCRLSNFSNDKNLTIFIYLDDVKDDYLLSKHILVLNKYNKLKKYVLLNENENDLFIDTVTYNINKYEYDIVNNIYEKWFSKINSDSKLFYKLLIDNYFKLKYVKEHKFNIYNFNNILKKIKETNNDRKKFLLTDTLRIEYLNSIEDKYLLICDKSIINFILNRKQLTPSEFTKVFINNELPLNYSITYENFIKVKNKINLNILYIFISDCFNKKIRNEISNNINKECKVTALCSNSKLETSYKYTNLNYTNYD